MTKGRMEAFSDGVFAIVITLLILEIHVPAGITPENLGEELLKMLPEFGAYFLSFFIVGLYWLVHHKNMHRLKMADSPLLWINLVWLLFISTMPFPTSLLGNFPLQVLPIVIYGTNLILANVTGLVANVYLKAHPELAADPITDKVMAHLIPRYIGVNGLYLVAIGLAWVEPVASYVIFFLVLLWLVYQYSTDRPSR